MNYRVISLKHRPQNFDELTGQGHVTIALKGAIKSGRIGHSFLFAGPRGVGKTTTARILAKSLNCIEGPTIHPCQVCPSCKEITSSRSIDVVEIDGASNRGIEEIRNLREGVKYSPLHGRYKIYIIDEVHMLTQEAFNALLKTLEEPPAKVIFIFATTNPIKIPATILSRCQRFVFKRLSPNEIIQRLRSIAEKEQIKITDNALHYLAIRADGSIRDGESILEQLASFVDGEISEDDIFKLIGFLGNSYYLDLLNRIRTGDLGQVIECLNQGIENGADPVELYRGFTNYLRSVLFVKTGIAQEFIELSSDERRAIKDLSISKEQLLNMLDVCLRSEEMIRRSVNMRIAIELLLGQLTININQTPGSGNETAAVKDNNPKGQPRSAVDNTASIRDLKQRIYLALQENRPKLAALIQHANIEFKEGEIVISVVNEFSKKQLIDNREVIESAAKQVIGVDHRLTIELVPEVKKDNDLVKTIKVLFDSEEVR